MSEKERSDNLPRAVWRSGWLDIFSVLMLASPLKGAAFNALHVPFLDIFKDSPLYVQL